ncbi:conserved hypothetical protein [Leishmania major strain Friedlin]|uniref:Uncharacterized protein n=1 Tax=Leishmania major TaxID=5664 RepID=Q4QHS1_LEIMA|nr:conserved hypothetical protein [Leishmania major strain Friedlin]CAG9569720.1 hypothetical_protein_-__conserved [Leishmania major strain Friedlin]CAJ02839.1 conserved hypothetical protein [Leishmania major strain Friedlin]|eukprot:XP_001681277.1 conserved hypothetical protein [Leishmania major strain Friedlin]
MGTADTVARPIASPSRAVHTSSSAPAQRPLTSARGRRAHKTAPFASPQPVLLRNPYGMERSRLVDALHGGRRAGFRAHQHGPTSSSHADAEALLSRQDAALYDACATRLRVVQQERRALAEKMEASKQQLEHVHALLDVWREKPQQPPATAPTKQAERDGAVPEPQPSSSPRKQETERIIRQLRELDRANDELRRRYEALMQEKRHCLTVHNARLRRPAPAAAPSSTISRRSSAVAACNESSAFARNVKTLETLLATAMAQQQTLQQGLALAVAKERGRITALTDLQARGFACMYAPELNGSAITSASREAGA